SRSDRVAAMRSDNHVRTQKTTLPLAQALQFPENCRGLELLPTLLLSLPLLLCRSVFVIETLNLFQVDCWLWQLELHIIQRVGHDLRHREVSKPFVICRNDKPSAYLVEH